MHLSVALDGTGWHPAAWREDRARPTELFTARYWVDVIAEAERGLLDFVTIDDGFTVQSSRTDQVTGRLDAVLIAAPCRRSRSSVSSTLFIPGAWISGSDGPVAATRGMRPHPRPLPLKPEISGHRPDCSFRRDFPSRSC